MATLVREIAVRSKHFVNDFSLSTEEVIALLRRAFNFKKYPMDIPQLLQKKRIRLAFEEKSSRTRETFEMAAQLLGGGSFFSEGQIADKRESLRNKVLNWSQWYTIIVARTTLHSTLQEVVKHSSIPVINALTDDCHPLQALADVMTLIERLGANPGSLNGISLAILGDGKNNTARSLMVTASRLGAEVRIAAPPQFQPDHQILLQARELAEEAGGKIVVTDSIAQAVKGVHAVSTDVHASMSHKDAEDRKRRYEALAPYRVTSRVMRCADPKAIFLHCQPVEEWAEVDRDVFEGAQSAVMQQAGNRLPTETALLAMILTR